MRRVVILGGGLAGLVTAKVLAAAGIRAELWEATSHFGGKAGSTQVGDRWADHGFHIFPAWYKNTNALLDELGIELRPGEDFFEVQPRVLCKDRRSDEAFKPIPYRIFSRTLLASLDLVSRPDWYLDDFSLDGFLRSRIYACRSSGNRLREISRKALASPAYRASALTMQRNLRFWIPVLRQPNWNALRGPMQTAFIEPLVNAATNAGAVLVPNRPVTGVTIVGKRIVSLESGADSVAIDDETDVVSALPVEVVQRIARDDPPLLLKLLELNSPLLQLQHLETEPLSALDLHLNSRLKGLPPSHFLLRHSQHDLTGLDITDIWDDYRADPDHPTVLQIVAGDTTTIRSLEEQDFIEALVKDVGRFFQITMDDVDLDHTVAMTHINEPLFMNTVGSNSKRVNPLQTGVDNLFMAGDHTDTKVDLASMEGAICSALEAAHAIGARHGVKIPERLPLHGVPKLARYAWKVLRYPIGLLASPLRLADMRYWGQELRDYRELDRESRT